MRDWRRDFGKIIYAANRYYTPKLVEHYMGFGNFLKIILVFFHFITGPFWIPIYSNFLKISNLAQLP